MSLNTSGGGGPSYNSFTLLNLFAPRARFVAAP